MTFRHSPSARSTPSPFSLPSLAALSLAIAGCVIDASGTDDRASPPQESVLCRLTLGVSTIGDAVDTLGPVDDRAFSTASINITYRYLTASYSEAAITFQANEADVLENAILTELPMPTCWQRDLAELEMQRAEEASEGFNAAGESFVPR